MNSLSVSPSKGFFNDFSHRVNLPDGVMEKAQLLFESLSSQHQNPRLLTRCCVLAVMNGPIAIHELVRGQSVSNFLSTLRTLIPSTNDPERLESVLSDLDFQVGLYSKFQETTKKLHIAGSRQHIHEVLIFAWRLFICMKNRSLFESGYLMASSLSYVIKNLPPRVQYNEEDIDSCLCKLFKTQAHMLDEWIHKTKDFIQTLKDKKVLEGENVLSTELIHTNCENLGNFYGEYVLKEEMLDERDFMLEEYSLTPLKDRSVVAPKNLDWEEINLETKLEDMKPKTNSAFIGLLTPMTIEMEVKHWYYEIIDAHPPEELDLPLQKLEVLFEKHGMKQSASSILAEHFENIDISLQNLNRPSEIQSLVQALGNFPCCLETFLYVHQNTSVTFEEVLEITGLNITEIWESVHDFMTRSIPAPVKWHFQEVEILIITSLAWTSHEFIKFFNDRILNPSGERSLPEKVLGYAASRIVSVCNKMKLDRSLLDNAWAILKHLFTHKSELLFMRHLDQIILCAIYAGGRPTKSLMFVKLIENYLALFRQEQSLVRQVLLHNEEYADIISFYNNIFRIEFLEFMNSLPENHDQHYKISMPLYKVDQSFMPGKPQFLARRTQKLASSKLISESEVHMEGSQKFRTKQTVLDQPDDCFPIPTIKDN